MACGRAVITSAAGGAAELVDDGVDAVTHSPGDPSSLSACLVSLARDPVARRELGSRARASACRRFDADRLTREVIAVYEAISR
jgi:glycosyltransferase involved in cell wall biosynthesis